MVVKPNPAPDRVLGRALRGRRESREESREMVAVAARISSTTLAKIELGQRDMSWRTARDVGEALGLDITELAAAVERAEREGDEGRRAGRGGGPEPLSLGPPNKERA